MSRIPTGVTMYVGGSSPSLSLPLGYDEVRKFTTSLRSFCWFVVSRAFSITYAISASCLEARSFIRMLCSAFPTTRGRQWGKRHRWTLSHTSQTKNPQSTWARSRTLLSDEAWELPWAQIKPQLTRSQSPNSRGHEAAPY